MISREFAKRAGLFTRVSLISFLIGAIFFWEYAFSQLPQEIFFQAKITKSDGSLLVGANSVTFRLYSTSSGGSALWSETQTITPDTSGIVSCYLGSVTGFPESLDYNEAYYLSIEVAGDGEMSPRIKLVPSFFSLNSDRFDGVDSSGFLRSDIEDTMEAPLTLTSYLDLNYSGSETALTVTQSGGGDILRLYSGTSGVLAVNNAGNVGIGTLSPSLFKVAAAGSMGPSADSTYDLGSNTVRWQNVYADNLHGNIVSEGISQGGVLFGKELGGIGQDISELYWDETNNFLGIGTSSPTARLQVGLPSAESGVGHADTGEDVYIAGNLEVDGSTWLGDASADTLHVEGTLDAPNVDMTINDLTINNDLTVNNNAAIGNILTVTGNVGIGVTEPTAKLDVDGTVKMTGLQLTGTTSSGYILTSNSLGVGTWQPVPSGADNLGNHIATQNIELNGNWLSGDGEDEGVLVSDAGNVGIGVSDPSARLHISAGGVRVGDMTLGGFVKNDDLGNLSGGNTISAGDIPASNLVEGTGIDLAGTMAGRIIG
ncbi:MAG: hypothetical protein PHE18_08140, partial [Candidatus Omnitrophica bacterium]|nr:hypothetical protein [Candidatus Omnitrophota bacterium]